MENIKLTKKIENNFRVIGCGSEGVVYYYANSAYKIFINSKYLDKENKFNKIKLLHNVEIDGVIAPEKIIVDNKTNNIGYSMKYIDAVDNLNNLTLSKSITLNEKIIYLKKTEKILKSLHNNNIVVGDINLFNFLIDKDSNIFAIDTDNYKIGKYKHDILPSIGFPYYEANVKNKIDKNLDKFLFTLYAIRNLANINDDYGDAILSGKIEDKNYLDKVVEALIVDKDFKKLLLKNFSGNGNALYIADKLDNMLCKSFLENKSFIDVKNMKK